MSVRKRFLVLVSAALLALAFVPAAFADDSLTFTMELEPSELTVEPGSEFTVSELLSCNESATYTNYSLSSYVEYDPNYFEWTDYTYSESLPHYRKVIKYPGYGSALIHLETLENGNCVLIYNYNSPYGNEPVWESGYAFATVTLRAKAQGTSTIKLTHAGVAKPNGWTYPCTALGTSVTNAVKCYGVSSTPFVGDEYLLTYKDEVAEGMHPTFKGQAFFRVNGVWTTLVTASAVHKIEQLKDFAVVSGEVSELGTNADINRNKRVNIVDAQNVLDLSNGIDFDFSTEAMLAADVNQDSVLDSLDARTIQIMIHSAA